ncbi:MAG: phytanoyl-CoA dioxygenase family protein [Rhodospirillaceae bacterium]|nr:phytanoyl-CoA dioxygenase family protein [Rhodospirillaceae bacterium]
MAIDDDTGFTVTEDDVLAYEYDGVVCLREVFDADWVERMRGAVDQVLDNPGPLRQQFRSDEPGEFISDKFMWTFNEDFRRYVFNSPAAAAAAALMRSVRANIFFDQILVKEPGAAAPSPWHQDVSYWPFSGRQVSSVWMPLDRVDKENGTLEFVRGSHLLKERPFSRDLVFGKDKNQPRDSHDQSLRETDDPERLPDIEADRDKWEIVSWVLNPGDAVVFTGLTLHGAPGNHSERRRRVISTRWMGDDIRYRRKRREATLLRDPGLAPGDRMDCSLFPVVLPRQGGGVAVAAECGPERTERRFF